MTYFIVVTLFIAWGAYKSHRWYHKGYDDGYAAGEAAMLETLNKHHALKEHPVSN